MVRSVSIFSHILPVTILIFSLIFRNRRQTRIEIIILHSTSDSRQRSFAFRKAPSDTRKIILATNIAESSITVPDVKYG